MTVTKRIVCLANSRKTSGRCLAGIEISDNRLGGWIRPVSDRDNQEVSEYERQYEDGSDPKLLDVIDVPLREHRPEGHQQENWLLEPKQYWKKIDDFQWDDLQEIAETSGSLWQNESSTITGINDQVPANLAIKEVSSLKLVHVDYLRVHVFAPGRDYGDPKRRVQGYFQFAKNNYALWVTDPCIERTYLAKENGRYTLGECYLTISLAEPFKEFCSKLIAAVIEK